MVEKKKMVIGLALASIIIAASVILLSSYSSLLSPVERGKETRISGMKYAKLLSIEDKGDYYIVTDSLDRSIVLVKEGKPVPNVHADLTLKLPVKRVVALLTTHVAYFEALNATDRLVGVISARTWYLEDVKQMVENGTIKEVGRFRQPNYEVILSLKPELVTVPGKIFGGEVVKKLDELGIPYISVDLDVERHPLGKLEWIKLFGIICGKEEEAIKFFERAEQRILNVEKRCEDLERTKVVCALLTRGRILIPGCEHYYAKSVEIAGGDYLFKDLVSERYVYVTVEDFLSRTKDADVFIAVHMAEPVTKKYLLSAVPELAETKPFKENKVYAMQPWIHQYAHKTDVFVEELASILHPKEFKLKKLTMFKQT